MHVKVSDLHIGKMKYDYIFLDKYLIDNGMENRNIFNTPHYRLLCQYEKNQSLDLRHTDYYRFAKTHFDFFGRWFGHTTENGLIIHMKKFLQLYDEIGKKGFSYSKGKIIVFKTVHGKVRRDRWGRPHPPTKTYEPKDYEIFEGHHRAAILAKLGYDEIDVDTYTWYNNIKNKMLKILSVL